MEELHRNHKETTWGWAAVLNDWRRSRARARLRKAEPSASSRRWVQG